MSPKIIEFDLPASSHPLLLSRLLFVIATIASLAAVERPAAAQDYPWCANFADGAGTNCGFSTQAQCMTTVAGSGGYCAENNLYKATAATAPGRYRVHKHHAASPAAGK
jgi:hypothetical protein